MGKTILDLSVRVARIIQFLELLKTEKAVNPARIKSKVPGCTLRILTTQGFVKTVGKGATLKVIEIAPVDSEFLELLAEEIWKEESIPRPPSQARLLGKSLPPALDTPLPPFLPLTVLEEVSNHIAAIASRLGIQCSGKTPPGMAQIIIKLQIENAELKRQLFQSQQEVQDAKKSLKKVAQNMREAAEKFDTVEKKIAPEEEHGTFVLTTKGEK